MIRTHSLADTRVLDKLLWSSGSERLRVILCAAIECANRFSESDVVTKVPQWLLVKLTRFYRVGVETPNKEAKIRYGRCTNTMTKLPTQNRKKKKRKTEKYCSVHSQSHKNLLLHSQNSLFLSLIVRLTQRSENPVLP